MNILSIKIPENAYSERTSLFQAHTPQTNYLSEMCHHYYCDFLSIAELIKSTDCVLKPFDHSHDEYEFLLPLSPTPLIIQNNSVYFGETGFVYPVHSGRQHATRVVNRDVSNYNITINKSAMEACMKHKNLSEAQFNSRFEFSKELHYLLFIFKSEFNKGSLADKNDLNLIGALIISNIVENGLREQPDRRKPSREYQKGMYNIENYINTHFCEQLSTEQLAKMCGFSKTYFISAFKKMMGEAPYTYIIKLRISKAKVLLEGTNLSVSEISSSCGFAKVNSFTSLFKRETGKTPTEYRAYVMK